MWLYVPSTCLNSAQASEGLAKDSVPPFPEHASSVMLRENPLLPRSWSRAWRTNPWMTLLSGLTSKPSALDRGAELWISSLAATRASPSLPQASDREPVTRGTSGPTYSESFASPSPNGASLKTSQDISALDTTMSSSLTLKALATGSRRAYSRRRKSGRPTDANGFSSWPTIRVSSGNGSSAQEIADGNPHYRLETLAEMWQTPSAGTYDKRRQVGQTERAELLLPAQAQQWATPRGNERSQHNSADHGQALSRQAPRTPMPGPESSQQGQTSPQQWPTPRHGKTASLDTHGQVPEQIHHRRLNPKFVLWMMGYPETHLDLAAPTNCGCSGTPSSPKP